METKQKPDILLLPVLRLSMAEVDELLGYKPQLGKEQIQKIYHDLAAEFAESLEEVMDATGNWLKVLLLLFLLQISILWLNHYTFAERSRVRWGFWMRR